MRLRLLTMNLWCLPWPISQDVEARVEAVAGRLAGLDADLLAFQEIATDDARWALTAAGRGAGYDHVWHANGDGGLLVLSRLPIRSASFTPYCLNGLPERVQHGDYYLNKGFAHLTVETAAGPLAVFTTHLHAKYSGNGWGRDYTGHRMAQVIELASAMSVVREPAVLLGDFNLHEGTRHYLALTELTGSVDVAAAVDRREITVEHTNPYRGRGHRPGRRIDYVFVRDGAEIGISPARIERVLDQPVEIDGRVAAYSDHAGLLAEVTLGTVAAPIAPPKPAALAVASAVLAQGRTQAQMRRERRQLWAGSGAAASLATLFAAGRVTASRRGFVRSLALGIPSLALVSCAGIHTLTDYFVPEELRRYDRIAHMLASLRARPSWPPRPEPPSRQIR